MLLIAGMLIAMASLSLSSRLGVDELEHQVKSLQQLMRLASEESVIQGVEIGLRITDKGFEFYQLGPEGWSIYDKNTVFRSRQLDDQLKISLIDESGQRFEPDKAEDSFENPDIIFLSSGEITPFAVELSAQGVDKYFRSYGRLNGLIEGEWIQPDA